MLIAFIFLMIVQLLPGTAAHASSNVILRTWSILWGLTVGIRFVTGKKSTFPKKNTAIFVSNHTSFLDTPAVYSTVKHRFKTLAKKSLLKIPILGLIFRTSGIMVDRSSPESRKRSFEAMVNAVQSGTSVMIFPEGTQNRTDNPLKDFYDGAFRLAITTQKPIIPVISLNARYLMPQAKAGKMRPGVIRHYFLDPIETKGLTEADVKPLKQRVYDLMEKKYLEFEGNGK